MKRPRDEESKRAPKLSRLDSESRSLPVNLWVSMPLSVRICPLLVVVDTLIDVPRRASSEGGGSKEAHELLFRFELHDSVRHWVQNQHACPQ